MPRDDTTAQKRRTCGTDDLCDRRRCWFVSCSAPWRVEMRHILTFVCVAALTASACGESSPAGPSGGSGTLNMRLTDSPFSDAKAVLVTFSEVSAHREDSDWTTVPFAADAGGAAVTERTCDLKKLQGPVDVLGGGLLTAGHYTQIRLVVKSATIYFDVAPDPA